ncbi:protein kinase [Streptomyces sp. NPDC048603]|uniref:protein kinase domain-containing protein n=1 Tax=Streptomyces sp. NPDC048603 TaxID=3365577 RepID=UPI00371727F5
MLIGGRYRVLGRLGRGGMGVVRRAEDELLGRPVAVKELHLDGGADKAAALREARVVAQIRHPHVVVVHDVVEHEGRPFIVMELVDGGSLADRLSSDGPLSPREAARTGLALLDALTAAHAQGVLHRDVKPANVLVEAGTGRVVLTDFGIASVAGATTISETGAFVGSPEYTAPERMQGASAGPAADLWSLGALLCTAVTGESPFRRDSIGGVLHAVVYEEIRPPARLGPLLPLVGGLLERDPGRRVGAAEARRLLSACAAADPGDGAESEETTGGLPPAPFAGGGYTPTERVAEPVTGPEAEPVTGPAVSPVVVNRAGGTTGGAARSGSRAGGRVALLAAVAVAACAGAVAGVVLLKAGGEGAEVGGAGATAPVVSSPASGQPAPPAGSASPDSGASGRPTGGATGPSAAPSASASASASTDVVAPGSPVVSTTPEAPVPPGGEVPDGYRFVTDERGFSLAVPVGSRRETDSERVFYVSSDGAIRVGIKVTAIPPGGALGAMRRAHERGPQTNPGYRDASVGATTYTNLPAALWTFVWDGFTRAEGARRTIDLAWEQDGLLYDLWVSAPVGRAAEGEDHWGVAKAFFVPAPR